MNIVRLGHLYTPPGHGINVGPGGRCETALVCGVEQQKVIPNDIGLVNLRVFDHEATDRKELHIRVEPPTVSGISFHLSGECPWKI